MTKFSLLPSFDTQGKWDTKREVKQFEESIQFVRYKTENWT